MKKNRYEIIINGCSLKKYNNVKYSYEKTNIDLFIVKGKARFVFERTVLYDYEDISIKRIFKDALKKVQLAHVLFYGKEIDIKEVLCKINDENERKIEILKLNSLLNGQSVKDIVNLNQNDNIIRELVKDPSNKESPENSCIYSMIVAESKHDYQEQFTYYWMAFNSFYSKIVEKDQKGFIKDNRQIEYVLEKYNYGTKISSRTERKKIAEDFYPVIKNWDGNLICQGKINKLFGDEIEKFLEDKEMAQTITPFGYLLADYSYYLRCAYVHGNKPTRIWRYEDEADLLPVLLAISVLKPFLLEHVYEIF